ncbi:Phosphoglycerate mutase-like protein 2 [Hibiscus syriacus]|uniref:Phosphoglycerate mutase-like protein 2 n=1 Tax=Hibiscus syriacus TaxID=106335 RepID=A0A6A2W9B3_HIBSY|nr:Phosphoglycerate mutase-like protein 2 [Hibiscus syriacus]
MDVTSSPGLYPLHRCKTLHLVRHAQGIHNVAGDIDFSNYLSEEFFDAHLTPLGWQQVDNLRKHVHETGLSKKIELVIVSPLLRTLQTAVGVFGGEGYKDGIDVPPLMLENAGESNRPAISSLNCPPFVAVELCREHLIDSNEDNLWEANYREKDEEIATRGMKFLNWVFGRSYPHTLIQAVDTRREGNCRCYSQWLLVPNLGCFCKDCHPSVKSEICTHFANCELRSVVLVDRCMLGSDRATTNYPGKIPSGPDLPSDVANEKLSNDKAGK